MKLMDKENDYILELEVMMGSFSNHLQREFKHLGVDASENVVKTAKG